MIIGSQFNISGVLFIYIIPSRFHRIFINLKQPSQVKNPVNLKDL